MLNRMLEVACCRNLGRAGGHTVIALGFVAARLYAKTLSSFLNDPDVDGHVVYTLIKMKAPGFISEVEPLLQSDEAWIRDLSRRSISADIVFQPFEL